MSNERKPKKVLLLTQSLELCGAERQLVELALGLDRSQYDIRIGIIETGGPLTEDLTSSGLPIVSFARNWRWDLAPVLRLATYLRRESIDIVHAFHFLPNFYSRFAGRLVGTPTVISSVRGTGIEGWHRYALDVATCGMCHALIINSEAGRDHYVSRGGALRKSVVIKNGINPKRFTCKSHTHPYRDRWNLARFDQIIGMVAAMEARKDQRLLLQAMKSIIRFKPRTGLLLIGDGSRRPALEHFTRTEGLEGNVVFTGQLRMPEHVYPLFDIYVQASYSEEGISNSILEAMSCSLPTVATDVGGNREVVEDGVTGRIVPAGDKDSLSQALLDLLNDPPRCIQMGQAGLARVRADFSLACMVEATQELYRMLLQTQVTARQKITFGVSRETQR